MLSSVSNSLAYAMLFQELYSANANNWHRFCSNSCPAFKQILAIAVDYAVWAICFSVTVMC